jgi:hypothetical protein
LSGWHEQFGRRRRRRGGDCGPRAEARNDISKRGRGAPPLSTRRGRESEMDKRPLLESLNELYQFKSSFKIGNK